MTSLFTEFAPAIYAAAALLLAVVLAFLTGSKSGKQRQISEALKHDNKSALKAKKRLEDIQSDDDVDSKLKRLHDSG